MATASIPAQASPHASLRLPNVQRLLWFLLGGLLGLLLAFAVVAMAPAASSFVSETRTTLSGLWSPPPPRSEPLPREWQWQPSGVDVGSMYGAGDRQRSSWVRSDVDRERVKRYR